MKQLMRNQLPGLVASFALAGIFFHPGISLAKEKAVMKKQKIAIEELKIDYAIQFPPGCEVKESPGTTVALCKQLTNDKANKVAANYPLFIATQQLIVPEKNLRRAPTLNRELAFYICSSASYENEIKIKHRDKKTADSYKSEQYEITCPGDKYGVIKPRNGHLMKIMTDKKIYRLVVRYLTTDDGKLSDFARKYMASFKLNKAKNL